MKYKRLMILFAILSLLVTAFIWGNSLQAKANSSEHSSRLAAILKPLVDLVFQIDEDQFHVLLRKAAHFAEFALLGVFVAGFSVNLGRLRARRYYALPMLITLLVAVTDEFIQVFSGRGSMVGDIVLDYAGALTGLGVVALICLIKRCMQNKKG